MTIPPEEIMPKLTSAVSKKLLSPAKSQNSEDNNKKVQRKSLIPLNFQNPSASRVQVHDPSSMTGANSLLKTKL